MCLSIFMFYLQVTTLIFMKVNIGGLHQKLSGIFHFFVTIRTLLF
jgi:hypothetical protein